MEEKQPLASNGAQDTHADWSSLVARAVDDVSRILHSESHLLQISLSAAVKAQIDYALAILQARLSVSQPRGIGARGHCVLPPTRIPASPAARPYPALSGRSPTLGLAYRIWPRCLNIMVLVKPAAVIKWHRQGFRLF